jgi:hypothetical protein
MPKLHCLHGGERQCIIIDVPPAVVADPAGSTLALGYYTWGRNTEARKILDGRIRKDNPLTFVDHVNEFFVEEVRIVVAGFVRAPAKGALNLATSPWRRGKLDWRAVVLVVLQQTAGRVVDIGERSKIARGATMTDETSPPQRAKQFRITINELTYFVWHRLGQVNCMLLGCRDGRQIEGCRSFDGRSSGLGV